MIVVNVVAAVCAAAVQPAAATADPPERAEYAVRWEPAKGGPATIDAVLDVLGLEHGDEPKAYTVEYFVPQKPPADAPEKFDAILRRRTSKKKATLTFKYRGTDHPIGAWRCPLARHEDPTKQEVDVSFVDGTHTESAFSYSCDVEGKKCRPSLRPSRTAARRACGE